MTNDSRDVLDRVDGEKERYLEELAYPYVDETEKRGLPGVSQVAARYSSSRMNTSASK